MAFESIQDFLSTALGNRQPHLKKIRQASQDCHKIRQLLQQEYPALASDWVVESVQDHQLTISAKNSAAAAELWLLRSVILEACQKLELEQFPRKIAVKRGQDSGLESH